MPRHRPKTHPGLNPPNSHCCLLLNPAHQALQRRGRNTKEESTFLGYPEQQQLHLMAQLQRRKRPQYNCSCWSLSLQQVVPQAEQNAMANQMTQLKQD